MEKEEIAIALTNLTLKRMSAIEIAERELYSTEDPQKFVLATYLQILKKLTSG